LDLSSVSVASGIFARAASVISLIWSGVSGSFFRIDGLLAARMRAVAQRRSLDTRP
jgi:hypothetical protein